MNTKMQVVHTPNELAGEAGGPERRHFRRALELRVQFRADRGVSPKVGLGTNLSAGGVFIASLEAEPEGTRLEVRFMDRGGFVVEGEVVHSVSGGMGIRFLAVEELISGLLTPPEERAAELPTEAASGPHPVDSSSPIPLEAPREATESRLADGLYEMVYADRERLAVAYQRDARTGGLFVPTRSPDALGSNLQLQVRIVGSGDAPASMGARVVHLTATGMGVEFADRPAALRALASLLEVPGAAEAPAAMISG